MKRVRRGLLVALVQLLLVSSLGAVLLIDRARLPRVWAESVPFDPDDPFRGRYVNLFLEARGEGFEPAAGEAPPPVRRQRAVLEVVDGELVARPIDAGPHGQRGAPVRVDADGEVTVGPLAFFIPEDVADPSRRPEGEALWVEVTVPRKGPPRPIRLGVLRAGESGPPRPLALR